MLKAYQLAVAGNAVDDLALERTVAALGVENVGSLAVKTLEGWPGGDVDTALLAASAVASARIFLIAISTLREQMGPLRRGRADLAAQHRTALRMARSSQSR
jgi:hypothetical protein